MTLNKNVTNRVIICGYATGECTIAVMTTLFLFPGKVSLEFGFVWAGGVGFWAGRWGAFTTSMSRPWAPHRSLVMVWRRQLHRSHGVTVRDKPSVEDRYTFNSTPNSIKSVVHNHRNSGGDDTIVSGLVFRALPFLNNIEHEAGCVC
jgi:hypothetical protein